MLTFIGLASSMTWVMAAGGWTGLNGESSVPEGGCNFTFIDWRQKKRSSFEENGLGVSETPSVTCWLLKGGKHDRFKVRETKIPWALRPAALCS